LGLLVCRGRAEDFAVDGRMTGDKEKKHRLTPADVGEHVPHRSNILFVVNNVGIGGAQRQTLTLMSEMMRRGWNARIAVLQSVRRELPELLAFDADTVWRAEFRGGFDPRGATGLARVIREIEPSLIVCVNTYPLLVAQSARRLAGSRAPVVVSFHTTELPDRRSRRHFRWLYRPLMNLSTRVVYVCEAQRQYWTDRGLRADTAVVIHNGISADWLEYGEPNADRQRIRSVLNVSGEDVLVGICAALRPEKAHGDMIEAIDRVRAQGRSFKAVFIGDGSCRGDLMQRVAARHLESAIHFVGAQDDVRPYIMACDIMALVSHSVETFSIAALESMAMARPLVLSDIGGAREQVIDSVNGFLYPRGDVGGLVDRLMLLRDPAVRHAMGQAGLRILRESFLLETMVDKYEDLFHELLDELR
jgi:glycosyltransferase involved in cell wall biosynthesis